MIWSILLVFFAVVTLIGMFVEEVALGIRERRTRLKIPRF